ncbi:MAG: MerR family transcriptional regulator [Elusimicrobiota bacterium]|jgi:DNA-binding transcriptional MerR regulator|nr:MerR family transcriptional regulator [Elusimicrobiota bacterium]
MNYTISQAAQKYGMTAHTLRYYDKEGLLPFVDRTEAGIRSFKESDFEGLTIIVCLKDTGMPVKKIKQFMDWCQQGDKTIKKRLNLFVEQKKSVERQIAVLNKHKKKIKYKIWYYQTALKHGTTDIHKEKECIKKVNKALKAKIKKSAKSKKRLKK